LLESHINQQLITQALLTQAAVASIMSKEGAKAFKKLIMGLSNGR